MYSFSIESQRISNTIGFISFQLKSMKTNLLNILWIKSFYSPQKVFYPNTTTHSFSLWLLYHIFYSKNIPSYLTSIKYRMFVKVFYPFLIFWKFFYPTYESKIDLKVWRREKGVFILEKMIVCFDTNIWGRFLDLSCESDNVSDVFEKMVPLQVKIES